MIDAYASKPWFVDHLAPVWRELGEDAGTFHVRTASCAAAAEGLARVVEGPPDGSAPIVTVGMGDHLEALRRGRTRSALGQHGAGQSYSTDQSSYPGGRGQEGVGLFLVPNDTARRRTVEAYPGTPCAVVGCPRLEDLPQLHPTAPAGVVAISTHWPARHSPEAGSAWETFGRALLGLVEWFPVIGHAHPRTISRLAPFMRAARIEVVPSFRDVLERASVYVTDNSSSLFEFAATGRPVVVLNSPHYRRDVDHGLRFWQASTVGINVDRPGDLVGAVTEALRDAPAVRRARERALDLVYQPRTGGARLAADALREWAG